jgi:hypothetical protein
VLIKLTKDASGVYSYDSAVSGVPLSPKNPSKNFFPHRRRHACIDGRGRLRQPGRSPQQSLHRRAPHEVPLPRLTFSGDDDVFVFYESCVSGAAACAEGSVFRLDPVSGASEVLLGASVVVRAITYHPQTKMLYVGHQQAAQLAIERVSIQR